MHDKGRDRHSKKYETETDVQGLPPMRVDDCSCHETGIPRDVVYNMFIEDLLRIKGC
jgi:hypothetical protein